MKKKQIIELRSYQLPRDFPVLLLSGEKWRISDVPSEILHFHNCTEIGLCCSDSGMIVSREGAQPFQEGDVTFISSDVAHTTYSTPGQRSKWCYLFKNLDELLFPYFSSVLLDCSIREALDYISINFFTIISKNTNSYYQNLLKLMMSVLEEKKANYQITFRSLMLAFVTNIMNEGMDSGVLQEKMTMTMCPRIEPALQHIHQYYQENYLSIEELATMCNLSLTHFRRLFKSSMKENPLNYINVIRIKAGMKLLTTTNDAIIDIAEKIGFQSISSFNRQFLKYTGMTPSEWRYNNASILQGELVQYNGWLEPPQEP